MELVKKNIVSIACGVIALVAVIVAFFPLGGFFEALDENVSQSERNYTDIQTLASQTFTKPIVDPQKTEAPPLEVFPTPAVIEAGKKAVETVATRSEEILNLAMKMNRRQPLVEDALPEFATGSAQGDFKRLYYARMDEWVQRLNGVLPPQASELQDAKKDLWERKYAKQVMIIGGVEQNKIDLEVEFNKEAEYLPNTMKRERADRGTLYVTRRAYGKMMLWDCFDDNRGIPLPDKSDLPELGDIWGAQLAIWIQDDIVEAIAETNRRFGQARPGSELPNVEGAVVKRLTKITVPKFYVTKLGQTPIAISRQKIPANMIPPADEPGQFKPFYGPSMTGRVSNALYDVVHFTLTVDVDARQINQFLNMLEANRFFTIRNINLLAVDRERLFSLGFLYGQAPVVQLQIDGEALFFRDWSMDYMPKGIKELMGIPTTAAAAGTTAF